MNSYVYKITNDLNEMVYIGTTTRPLCKRISDHRYNAIKRGNTSKLHEYIGEIDVERFKMVCVSVKLVGRLSWSWDVSVAAWREH